MPSLCLTVGVVVVVVNFCFLKNLHFVRIWLCILFRISQVYKLSILESTLPTRCESQPPRFPPCGTSQPHRQRCQAGSQQVQGAAKRKRAAAALLAGFQPRSAWRRGRWELGRSGGSRERVTNKAGALLNEREVIFTHNTHLLHTQAYRHDVKMGSGAADVPSSSFFLSASSTGNADAFFYLKE